MRFWARGGSVSRAEQEANLRQQAEMYGMDFEQFRQVLDGEEKTPEIFGIYPDNAEALGVFLACATQWRYDHGGKHLGIDYTALESVMRLLDVKDTRQVFADVRTCERAFLGEVRRG